MFGATIILFLVFAAAVPFAHTPLPELSAFVPSASAVMLINDFITSILLYGQYSILPSRSLLVLASGYLFTALVIIPHALTFPGAFTATGLIEAGLQTTAWLYFSAHFVFAGLLLSYAWLKDIDRANPLPSPSTGPAIAVNIALVMVFVCGLTLTTTLGSQYLPAILTDRTHAARGHLTMINGSIICITAVAFIELWIRRRTILDYCLMLICVALIQEEGLFFLAVDRFTLGFYAGRAFWLLTSVVVLTVLLQETARLYMRLARSHALLERERDNRLWSARAIAASIAHEVKQPLTAMVASGGAALEYLRKTPPDHDKVRSAVDKMIREGHRTGDTVESIRALFDRGEQKLEPVDINKVILNVLESLRGELLDHGVATFSELPELPLVKGRRNQLQQVVFNLVHNALEAMQGSADRKRELRVSTERRGLAAVALVVEDTGPGIDPTQLDSIFNAFVSTKSHGMGLGLAICGHIVERLGGQLSATSDGSSGARFQVLLPLGPTDSGGDHT